MKGTLSRRTFLKWSAAVGGLVAFTGPINQGLKKTPKIAFAAQKDDVKIINTAGLNNCGGRCVIKAHVKDGVIIRISTDTAPDNPEAPQVRACVRGRSYRKTWLSPDRLKYPMKRVGKRGEGKFERITWEEALTTVAEETRRIKENFGPSSRYVHYSTGIISSLRPSYLGQRLLSLDGGYLDFYNTYSTACTDYATPFTYGTSVTGNSQDNWVNSKLIILWGFNPAETVHGSLTMYSLKRAKEAGAKVIVVDPRHTDTAVALADQWIPLLPTTDNAVMDAMAYIMITENLYDKAFVDKFCLGFDEDHMPEGVPGNESFKDYILGTIDGVPKTTEWAARISKVPADVIRQLARDYATSKPAALIQGWGPQRHAYGEQPARGATVLASITGNVGIKGGWASGVAYPGRPYVPFIPIPPNPFKGKIPVFAWSDAVVRGKQMTAEDGVEGVDRLPGNIKMIWNLAGNALINQHSDINKTATILQDESKVEFILASEIFLTPSAKFADILLPGATNFESEDVSPPWVYGDYAVYANKVIDPPFECRSHYDWMVELADKMDLKDKFTQGRETAGDWCKWIVAGIQKKHPQFPDHETFKKQGIYKFNFKEPYIAFKKQIQDPENNPFPTPSGKIEIFSKRLYDMKNPEEIPAVPKYIEAWEGPWDPLTKQYPLQCIGWHYKRRCHSIHDNNPWLEEAGPQEMWINPEDAKARRIKDGDRVKVFNDRGTIIIQVKVTPRIIPGVVAVPQGAWWTPDKNGVDQRGSINVLTKQHPTPLAKGNPQHTNLVEVAKI